MCSSGLYKQYYCETNAIAKLNFNSKFEHSCSTEQQIAQFRQPKLDEYESFGQIFSSKSCINAPAFYEQYQPYEAESISGCSLMGNGGPPWATTRMVAPETECSGHLTQSISIEDTFPMNSLRLKQIGFCSEATNKNKLAPNAINDQNCQAHFPVSLPIQSESYVPMFQPSSQISISSRQSSEMMPNPFRTSYLQPDVASYNTEYRDFSANSNYHFDVDSDYHVSPAESQAYSTKINCSRRGSCPAAYVSNCNIAVNHESSMALDDDDRMINGFSSSSWPGARVRRTEESVGRKLAGSPRRGRLSVSEPCRKQRLINRPKHNHSKIVTDIFKDWFYQV